MTVLGKCRVKLHHPTRKVIKIRKSQKHNAQARTVKILSNLNKINSNP